MQHRLHHGELVEIGIQQALDDSLFIDRSSLKCLSMISTNGEGCWSSL